MNNIALTVALATAPSTAFAELRERPRFWFPLLVLVFSTVAIVYWYYSVVDIEWLKDLMFSNNPDLQALPQDKRADAMAMLGRNTMLWGSVAGAFFVMPIVFLVSALYFLLAAKVTKLPQGFKHWFAFSCWTAMPMLLSAVVAIGALAVSFGGAHEGARLEANEPFEGCAPRRSGQSSPPSSPDLAMRKPIARSAFG